MPTKPTTLDPFKYKKFQPPAPYVQPRETVLCHKINWTTLQRCNYPLQLLPVTIMGTNTVETYTCPKCGTEGRVVFEQYYGMRGPYGKPFRSWMSRFPGQSAEFWAASVEADRELRKQIGRSWAEIQRSKREG